MRGIVAVAAVRHPFARRIAVLAVLAAFCLVRRVSASSETLQWQVGGDRRQAIVHVPSGARRGVKRPLVLSFHGRGDNSESFQQTDLHGAWPEAIVVYFQGLRTAGGLTGWQIERGEHGDRDLTLVDVALASLRQTYDIDEDRLYATGFSNGAMFTYLLWAERPGLFAAHAPVAGRLGPSVRPSEPTPILHVAGERDRQVSFADQQAAIGVAIDVNGVGTVTRACGEGCTVHGPDTSVPVVAWIHPGAHVYPVGTSERIAAFFREHPRRRRR